MKIDKLPNNPKLLYQHAPKEIKQVAEGMETQFAHQLISEMNKTVQRSNPESSSEAYYRSLLDYERAKAMAQDPDGLGLKQVIADQLMPQHMKQAIGQKIQQKMAKESYNVKN